MRVIDEQNEVYEVLGIAIFKENNDDFNNDDIIFLLDNGFEVSQNEVKIIDNRIPFDWHLNIFETGYYMIMGFKELVYSIDLIDWDRCGNEEAGVLMKRYIKHIKSKKWQEKLSYYDEYLNYTDMMNNMEYEFLIENIKGANDESSI